MGPSLLKARAVRQHPTGAQKRACKMFALCTLFAPSLGHLQATRRRSKKIPRKMLGIYPVIQEDQYRLQPGVRLNYVLRRQDKTGKMRG
jgi:hypothetical protein